MASHVFHQCCYHIVWHTKNDLATITSGVLPLLLACIEEECPKRGGVLHACNAMPNHVHVCVNLPPGLAVATFVGQINGATSYVCKRTFGEERHPMWQEGYGVVTFRQSETDKVVRYVRNQQEIHAARKASRLLECITPDAEM